MLPKYGARDEHELYSDAGYVGDEPIGFVEVHISDRQKVIEGLEKLGLQILFVW